jgi:hypothetical protein
MRTSHKPPAGGEPGFHTLLMQELKLRGKITTRVSLQTEGIFKASLRNPVPRWKRASWGTKREGWVHGVRGDTGRGN